MQACSQAGALPERNLGGVYVVILDVYWGPSCFAFGVSEAGYPRRGTRKDATSRSEYAAQFTETLSAEVAGVRSDFS